MSDGQPLVLDGRVAVISGGLGDIGGAVAVEFAACGVDVALGDLAPPDAAEPLLERLAAAGVRATYRRVDVSRPEQVRDWLDEVVVRMGAPDLVVPAAGAVVAGGLLDGPEGSWADVLDVNLSGPYHLAAEAARRLRAESSPGRIVFVGSWAGHRPHPRIGSYSVSKAGLRMLCRCLALELAPHRILVNEVAPGYVDAGLSKRIFDTDPAAKAAALAAVPTGELHTAQEVARLVVMLCSAQTRGVTGATLVADGGLSLLAPGNHGD